MSMSHLPRARREGLNIHAIGTEVLVFDPVTDSAHALNGPAAYVWQHADGKRTVQEIADEMTLAFGAPADAQVVWYALGQLQSRQLLDTPVNIPAQVKGMTRRQFLKRAAAGAVLLAVVTSIVAPSVAHAQSGCLTENTSCISNPTGCCVGLICCSTGFTCKQALQCTV